MTKENKDIVKLREIAAKLELKFIIESPITPKEPVLAVVNKRNIPPTLKAVSRNKFAQENNFTWVESIFAAEEKNNLKCRNIIKKYEALIKKSKECEKALLETDYGFALINITPIQAGQAVAIYEGELQERKICLPEHFKDFQYESSYSYRDGDAPVFIDHNYDEDKRNCVRLGYLTELKIEVIINANKFRGFGSFMQSLVSPQQLHYYQFKDEHKHLAALGNVSLHNRMLPTFTATTDIPPLSLLGLAYGMEYFKGLKTASVPFNINDGFSLPYEIAYYGIHFVDKKFPLNKEKDRYFTHLQTFFNQNLKQLADLILKNEVVQLRMVFLRDKERDQIIEHISKKHINFSVYIEQTPDILIFKAAYIYYNSKIPSLKQYVDEKPITELSPYSELNKDRLFFYKRIKLIAENKQTHTETSVWLQYFENQHAYFSALDVIMECIKKHDKDKSSPAEKIKKVQKKYSKLKEGDYSLLLRNIALNVDIINLWCLIKEKQAINYINESSSNNKTPLFLALESKNESKKLTTCLLLLEFKADPNLQDDQGRTPLSLAKNSALSFLFKRLQSTDPDNLGESIEAAALKQGFGNFLVYDTLRFG